MSDALDLFSPPTAAWFRASFEAPTDVQARGWPAIAGANNTLMCAPTGSGKTLAAFLWCLDALLREPVPAAAERCRVLYVSPLKALTVDVERNLRSPLRGIAREAGLLNVEVPDVVVQVRTGDTPADERRRIQRQPPDILITTPESLFLMLTSAAREVLRSVRWVIVDEVHSVLSSKRGAHLAVSLERLSALTTVDPVRIGLSATVRPLDEAAKFLGGDRPVTIVDAGRVKPMEITVEVPVDDMANLERGAELPSGPAAAIGGGPAAPRRSIWPAIHPRILELVRQHRSTIIFVNSRRLAERLASRLNELAGEELVRAHHGSIARDQRLEIESLLKEGRIPALVATSSLELGIDMGAVDLVIQVEAPGSVASALQRVGRAGHGVGETSQGTIFPKHRGDLLETALVVERMLLGEIESSHSPRNALDILAQQVVAMTALEEWSVDELFALFRRAHPFSDLGRRNFDNVLDMLSGRYPSDDFAELRPRINWDRVAGQVRGRSGAQWLAVTSGGTIPDRGLYTVNLFDGGAAVPPGPGTSEGTAQGGIATPPGGRRPGRRVGELDEEMVYEMRPGQTFVLGATTWKVVEITPQQVIVQPAPGEPGTIAFWNGDAVGRPVELGIALGAMLRELNGATRAEATLRLRTGARLDTRATNNLIDYIDEQRASTGVVPDDANIVVERFRDQLGDWRICVLTPFGARIHAPWALAARARLEAELGIDVQAIHTDDGFAIRIPDLEHLPPVESLFMEPEEVREAVVGQLHGSALFASRFRENAARALLLPRRRPNMRTPLWQQRQRSHTLLQVASAFPAFPIVLETYRECLNDVFDMDGLVNIMASVRDRRIHVTAVETQRASPFAASLMFDYIAQYMYDGDAPMAERRAQALTLDRELLAELIGSEELRELLDPAAVASVEIELQGLLESRWPRDEDEAADCLRRLGDLTGAEASARGVRPEWLATLTAQRRAFTVRFGSDERWVAAEDAGRLRDAFGVPLPAGLPETFLEPTADPLRSLVMRWARTHAPFAADDIARRWGLSTATVEGVLRASVARGEILGGGFSRGSTEPEYCHPEVLRLIRRRSLATLRREVEPVPAEALGRFLPAWNGVAAGLRGPDRLLEALRQVAGAALPASVLERDILPVRVDGYQPGMLDQLAAAGEIVWVGRGALGTSDGRVGIYPRAEVSNLLDPSRELPPGELHERLRAAFATRGALFFPELVRASAGARAEDVLAALWDMAWAGEVTNDTFLPLRAVGSRGGSRSGRTRRPLMRLTPPGAEGRWSRVADLLDHAVTGTERLHAIAGMLLQRYGVVTREVALAEQVPGGFSALYPVLAAMEEAGRVRRGYFIDGLGGSQFALPGAVDRLRAFRESAGTVVALAAVDPANPYGVTLPWPASAGKPSRSAGAFVVLEDGRPSLFAERGMRNLLTFGGEVSRAAVEALAQAAGRTGKVEVLGVDGGPVTGSPLDPLLRGAGFEVSPRGLVRWPQQRYG